MSNPVTINAPEGLPFIEIERDFDAPVEAVFRAYAEPELVKQWLGPHDMEMELNEYNCSSGGQYRYVHRDPAGEEYPFRGMFHTVRENELIVQTFEFEGFPDVVSIESMTFTDLGNGRSKVTGQSAFPSVEARDGIIASDMETGVVQGYERLDKVLAQG
ncbi:SRPBCC family protein [Propionibacteriaceae bacterium Y1685]|uniref:SRPBCC family protein n=1 Tax=Microlunatus sp. Y1700 TaxID=3418487 RepID=UPI003B82C276